MQCRQCQANNPTGAKFCMGCGAPLAPACPQCSASVAPEAKFCPQCGRQLQQGTTDPAPTRLQQYIPAELLAKLEAARGQGGTQGERRIVTMLFCDVKGSTAAASSFDPEEWAEIMNGAFQHLIAPVYRYEGTLARLMGDAILAFFGAPVAHEDDPQRAVLAGLGILEGIQEYRERVKRRWGLDFNVRVGINTGLVVVGEVGSDLRVEYTAMGDAVNLAARMEQTAEPATVQIAESTYRLIAPLFDCQDLGGVEVKGKQEPVHAYRVLRARVTPGRLRGIEGLSAPLIGRDQEMRALLSLVDGLRQGRGHIVSVMGDAGLGKSRLIAELRGAVAPSGPAPARSRSPGPASPGLRAVPVSWLEGRSLSYQSATPYAPFLNLLSDCYGLRPEDTDEEKQEKLRALLDQVMPERTADTAPFIASLLGLKLAGEDLEKVRYLEPSHLRARVFAATRSFIQCLASSQPLVLVFEDLHWSDPTSLELLEQLLPLTDQTMLLVVAVFRPQRQEPSWRFHEVAARNYEHRYTAFTLEPLDEGNTRELVANLLQIEGLPENVRALIFRKSEGNPFFVEEVIRSLLDAGVVVRDGDHWRATREVADIAVPDTIAGVLTARLDRLDEPARRVAQTASVIGREFEYDTLASVHETPQALEPALAELQRRGLVRERSRLPRRVYLFKHSLTQEAAYGSLLFSQRRRLHRQVAENLERTAPDRASEIARHFLEAREEARALPHLVAAGEHAAFACSLKDAVTFFRQALDILESVRDAPLARRAYDGLGGALALSFDTAGAVDVFHKMIHVAETYANLPMQVSALNKLARVTGLMQGQFPEAFEHLGEAERLAMLCQDLPGLTELHMSYCALRTISGDIDGALEHQRKALQIGNQSDATDLRLFGMAHCANSLTYLTHFDEARQQALEALAAAEKAGNRSYMTWPLVMPIPYYHLRLGDLETAQHEAKRGTDIATQIGAEDGESIGAFMLGHMARLQGRYEEAMAWQRRAIGAAHASGFLFVEAGALCALGSLYLEISDKNHAQAEEHHAQALNMMDNPFGLVLAAQSWTDMGFWALARSQADQAKALFQKALTGTSTFRYLVRPAALVGSALAAREQGNSEEANRLLVEARAFAEERTMRLYYPLIALGDARVAAAGGETDVALERFARAEGLALEMNLLPQVWQARAGAVQALAGVGRSAEAEAKRSQAQAAIAEIASMFTDQTLGATFLSSATRQLP